MTFTCRATVRLKLTTHSTSPSPTNTPIPTATQARNGVQNGGRVSTTRSLGERIRTSGPEIPVKTGSRDAFGSVT